MQLIWIQQWHCIPNGVPRSGAPRQIVQTPKLIVFMYQDDIARADSRLIPTDGRPHRTDVDPSYNGDSIGHWEGDTLVVDVNQLSDETWLSRGRIDQYGSGYFHSDATPCGRADHPQGGHPDLGSHGGGSEGSDQAMGDDSANEGP